MILWHFLEFGHFCWSKKHKIFEKRKTKNAQQISALAQVSAFCRSPGPGRKSHMKGNLMGLKWLYTLY